MSVTELDHRTDRLVIDLPGRPRLAIAPDMPSSSLYVGIVKPAIDRVVAGVLLVMILPVLLVVAAAIRLTMGRGVLFCQERVGEHGKPFTVLKFRTMLPDRRAPRGDWYGEDRRLTHKTED